MIGSDMRGERGEIAAIIALGGVTHPATPCLYIKQPNEYRGDPVKPFTEVLTLKQALSFLFL